jgi:integrase
VVSIKPNGLLQHYYNTGYNMSRAKIVFTDTMIKRLKPELSEYRKSEGNGFTIRVMPSGFKSWLYLYVVNGRRRCMNLGQYPEVTLESAREKFETAYKAVKNGIDPMDAAEQAAEEKRKAPTVSELFVDYMKRHAKLNKRESSWMEDQRLFAVNVDPAWGQRKAADIKKRDCVELLDHYTDRPALCQNLLSLMRKVYNFAVEKDLLEVSPFIGVRSPVKVQSRTRVLSEDEVRELWLNALPNAAMSDEIKCIIKLLLLTGQRVGEVCGMTAEEVDGRWWTIPAERSKSKIAHRVFLTDTALKILSEPTNGYYFCSQSIKFDKDKKPIYTHIKNNAVALALRRSFSKYATCKKMHFNKTDSNCTDDQILVIKQFTPHDLRRTVSTFIAVLGYSDEINDAVLGHKKTGIIKVYNQHKYDFEKENALRSIENKILDIINYSE